MVGSLGNASDQEVDTETVHRAAELQRDALLLLAAVAATAGAVVVAQAVSRHLQRRPSDARRARGRRAGPPSADGRRADVRAAGGPRRRRRRCRVSPRRRARRSRSGRSAASSRSRGPRRPGAARPRRARSPSSPAGMAAVFAAMRWARTTPVAEPGRAQRRRHADRAAAVASRGRDRRPLRPRRRARCPAAARRPDAGDGRRHRRHRRGGHRRAHQPRPDGRARPPGTGSRGTSPSPAPRRARVGDARGSSATRGCRAPISPAPASSTRTLPDGRRARSRRSGSTASVGRPRS